MTLLRVFALSVALTAGGAGAQANTHGVAITLANSIGSSPSAAGATLSVGKLTLQPADATHAGVVTTGAQIWGGLKTLSGGLALGSPGITFNDTTTQTTAAAAPTIATFGSSPTANGATVSGSAITLQPTDGTNPGAMTAGTQTLGGAKTWTGAQSFQSSVAVASNLTVSTNVYHPTDTPDFFGNKSDGATTVGIRIGAGQALATAGAKVVSFCKAMFSGTNTEVASIDKDGNFKSSGYVAASAGYGLSGSNGAVQGMAGSGSNTFIAAAGDAAFVGLNSNTGNNFLKAGIKGIAVLGPSGPSIQMGTGDPSGVVTAIAGSMWLRTDGGAGTTFYVKESGTGNTGWVAK